MPERYGPWATLHTRFRRWAADGTFERMLRAAQAKADAAGNIEWLVSVDSTVVRAHQPGSASTPTTSNTSDPVRRGRPWRPWSSSPHRDPALPTRAVTGLMVRTARRLTLH
ncbi:transposase [Streptomyces sp. M2CJ-2]|nr:transposase [Streptomyces sp. M2CJ-2]